MDPSCWIFLSTQHQLLKFVLEDNEIVIHDERSDRSNPYFYIPIIEDSCRGIDFQMVEIMKDYFYDTTPQVPIPLVYKMLAMTILRRGFEPRMG